MLQMEFTVRDKKISVFGNVGINVPIVYLNTVHGEGQTVWEACQKMCCPPFILAEISGLNWDHDMSPWAIGFMIGDIVVGLLVIGGIVWIVLRLLDEKKHPEKYKHKGTV